MRFHLQLYPPKLLDWVIVLLVLFLPASVAAWMLHSVACLILVPAGIVVLGLLIAALPIKGKVTPEQFADELERLLLGTEDEWDWDDITSVSIADEHLERIRTELPRLLAEEKAKDELKAIIASLRRGEIPELYTTPPTYLTYPNG